MPVHGHVRSKLLASNFSRRCLRRRPERWRGLSARPRRRHRIGNYVRTASPDSSPAPTAGRPPGGAGRLAAASAGPAGQGFREHLRLGRKGLAIGVDIGGTKVAAGVVDAEGRILAQARRSTPGNDPRAVERVIVELVEELGEGHRIWSVGIGAAGWMDLDGGTVLFSPHLAWRNEPLRDNLQQLLRRPVLLTNDADAAAWAEWRFGAGQGKAGWSASPSAPGSAAPWSWTAGWSADASAWQASSATRSSCPAATAASAATAAAGSSTRPATRSAGKPGNCRRQLPGGPGTAGGGGRHAESITGAIVTELAQAGDPTSRELLEDVGEWLGLGLANLAAALDPGMFVIGGGLCDAGELLVGPARKAFARNLTGRGFRPAAGIELAALGPECGPDRRSRPVPGQQPHAHLRGRGPAGAPGRGASAGPRQAALDAGAVVVFVLFAPAVS